MHSDDHILEHFIAGQHPLPALATHLGMTLIALVQWVDRNADLLAVAKRAMEAHLAFLALKAEAAALIDLTSVSSSTTNEERKRKSSSQLLRHAAKRLLTNPTRERGAPCAPASASGLLNQLASSQTVVPPSPREAAESVGEVSLPSLVQSGVPPVPISSTKVPSSTSSSALEAATHGTSMPSSPPEPLSLSDREIDVLMVTLARHFNIDLSPDAPDPAPA